MKINLSSLKSMLYKIYAELRWRLWWPDHLRIYAWRNMHYVDWIQRPDTKYWVGDKSTAYPVSWSVTFALYQWSTTSVSKRLILAFLKAIRNWIEWRINGEYPWWAT